MNKEKIVLTGASGMLGSFLLKYFSAQFEIITVGRANTHFKNDIELCLSDSIDEVILEQTKNINPKFIIHCAAITSHLICDNNPINCIEVNSISILKLKKLFKDAIVIFISSDAVFGDANNLRHEESPTHPSSIYGKSKLLGEQICSIFPNYCIIRTTIVGTSLRGNSLVDWIYKNLTNDVQIEMFNDVLFNPISIFKFSVYLQEILNHFNRFDNKIIHLANSEVFSKYEFGIAFTKKLNANTNLIKIGSLRNYEKKGNRCFNQVLNTKETKLLFPSIKDSTLDDTLNEIIRNGKYDQN